MTRQNENPYRIEARNRQDAVDALAEAEAWLQPASREALTARISELYVAFFPAGRGDPDDKAATLALFVKRLRDYPGDIALKTIDAYRGDWFPKLDDLRRPIEQSSALRDRLQRVSALRDFVAGRTAAQARALSPEERKAVSEKMQALKAEVGGP